MVLGVEYIPAKPFFIVSILFKHLKTHHIHSPFCLTPSQEVALVNMPFSDDPTTPVNLP